MVAAGARPTRLGFTPRMRRLALPLLLVLAALLAGCTSTGSSSSSKKFAGAAGDVSKAVDDLEAAGQRKNAGKLCSQLLARSLVSQIGESGTTCTSELDKALADSDDFKLDVRDIKVNGDKATATVLQGDPGSTRTIQFVREDNRWKATGFSTG
jgi:hypothetical protein